LFNPVAYCFHYKAKDLSAPLHICLLCGHCPATGLHATKLRKHEKAKMKKRSYDTVSQAFT
jgi:hypothetical protein